MAGRRISKEDRQRAASGLAAARAALGPRQVQPPAAYYARLPRHIAAAGALFHADDRVLLVQPRHRPGHWTIPGGATDSDDPDPHHTARREVNEETGLTLSPTAKLLAVDWVPADAADNRPPLTIYVFDGGHLTPTNARRQITLRTDELTDWRYAGPAEWPALVAPHLDRRLTACLEALNTGTAMYLHHGWPPGQHPEQ